MRKKRFFSWTVALAAALLFVAPSAMAEDVTAEDLVAEAKKSVCEISVSEANACFDKGGWVFVD